MRTLLALVLAAAPAALSAQSDVLAAPRTPAEVIMTWPKRPGAAAVALIKKYGRPQRFGAHALIWENAGPWKRTVVYSNAWPTFVGAVDKDFLEQTIDRPVPADKVALLRTFDTRITVNEADGELSSRSESEAANYLALNLADDLVSGKRGAGDARAFQERTSRLAAAGKSSPYLEGFLFHRP